MAEPSSTPRVDAERPWLGLLPFTESTQRFFFGRDAEIREIYLRVREQPLTVLYGPSGLGKSSLLGAGLIPKLRVEGYRPLLLRLHFEKSDPPLLEQVRTGLDGLLGSSEAGSLWERFHHREDPTSNLVEAPPALIFDQFEEIFTLTESSQERQRQAAAFFEELADLLENRPPQKVQEQLRADRTLAQDYDFAVSPLRVVLTLRQDYLSQLEVWKKRLPSLMRNRMELRLLSGKNALEAVVAPGRLGGKELVKEEVGERIVCFVAKRPPGTPIGEISAVPPILSLLCYELNEARLKDKTSKDKSSTVSGERLEEQGEDILQSYYDRCFAALPSGREEVRRFVEERMLTSGGGHRNVVALEDAVATLREAGVKEPKEALTLLIAGRLLSPQEQGGVERLEITHDVLAPLAMRSREKRRERERAEKAEKERQVARRERMRLRWVTALVSVLGIAALAFGVFALFKNREAQKLTLEAEQLLEEASRKALGRAQMSFQFRNEPRAGLAYLNEALIYRPTSKAALERIAIRLATQPTISAFPEDISFLHSGPIYSAKFSADSIVVVTAGADMAARLWMASTGQPIGEPLRHDSEVLSAAISPNGQWVVTANRSGARIWEREHGILKQYLETGETADVSFSLDSNLLLTAGHNTQIWNLNHGRADRGRFYKKNSAARRAALSPDGRSVLTSGLYRAAQLWDLATGLPIGKSFPSGGLDAQISPDNCFIVTTDTKETAQVWEIATRAPIGQKLHHNGFVFASQFSPDGRLIVTASNDETARIWVTATGKPASEPLHLGAQGLWASFSPDGRKVVVAGADGSARLWATSLGRPVPTRFHHWGMVNAASFSPGGGLIVTASSDQTAQLWDFDSGKALGEPLHHDASVNTAGFSPDGKLIVTASENGTAQLWATSSGKPMGEPFRHGESILAAAFSPDGQWIVTASADTTAQQWSATTREPRGKPLRHGGSVEAVNFSPDGQWIVTASDKTVQLWRAATSKRWGEPLRHKNSVTAAGFSPDGKWIITASFGAARLWEVSSGKLRGELPCPDRLVFAANFSPDGRSIITSSSDKTTQLWNAATHRPIGEPLSHGSTVNTASFSPNGRWLLTASNDRAASLWDLGLGGEPLIPSPTMTAALEAVAGQRVLEDGLLEDIPPSKRLKWRKSVLSAPSSGLEWDRLVRWYLADPRTRTVSPNSKITIPEHIENEINWALTLPTPVNALSILDEAYLLDPAHPLIHFALAAVEESSATREVYLRLGLERLPYDARICTRAAEILRLQRDATRALVAAEKALKVEPNNVGALAAQAWANYELAKKSKSVNPSR